MELTGKLVGVQRDYMTRKPVISFVVEENPHGIEKLNDVELQIKFEKRTRPRTMDSNKYFHVLCDKLRQSLGISMADMKNQLITSYGQILYMDDGNPACIKTNIPPEMAKEMEEPHLKYIKAEGNAYWYKIYRGSHTYNTVEMHKLIEGTVFEAKGQGIETATPMELERMENVWKLKCSQSTED